MQMVKLDLASGWPSPRHHLFLPLLLLLLLSSIIPPLQSYMAPLPSEMDRRCAEPMDTGPCHYFQLQWYWDSAAGQCRQFNYGGCLGNANRFATREACQGQCLYRLHDQNTMPPLCLLDPDPGYCPAESLSDPDGGVQPIGHAEWWYYFNAVHGVCEQFLFYGCGPGNGNRFYSLHQCNQVCGERKLGPKLAIGCERCDIRTSYCRFHGKYNNTCECRPGYEKREEGGEEKRCADIDECSAPSRYRVHCGLNAQCRNLAGAYACECPEGYTGDPQVKCTLVGLATPADSCSLCSADAKCTVGGVRSANVTCQCRVGFRGDGLNCTDVDECNSDSGGGGDEEEEGEGGPCDSVAHCENLPGSYRCECPLGWAGDGFECWKAIDSCLDRTDPRELQARCDSYQPAGSDGSGKTIEWRQHYYFDHSSLECSLVWVGDARCREAGESPKTKPLQWLGGIHRGGGGMHSRRAAQSTRNLFSDLGTCEAMCERSGVLELSDPRTPIHSLSLQRIEFQANTHAILRLPLCAGVPLFPQQCSITSLQLAALSANITLHLPLYPPPLQLLRSCASRGELRSSSQVQTTHFEKHSPSFPSPNPNPLPSDDDLIVTSTTTIIAAVIDRVTSHWPLPGEDPFPLAHLATPSKLAGADWVAQLCASRACPLSLPLPNYNRSYQLPPPEMIFLPCLIPTPTAPAKRAKSSLLAASKPSTLYQSPSTTMGIPRKRKNNMPKSHKRITRHPRDRVIPLLCHPLPLLIFLTLLPLLPLPSPCHSKVVKYHPADINEIAHSHSSFDHTERCRRPFDEGLRRQCGDGRWQHRYFYNTSAGPGGAGCQMFYWDECRTGVGRGGMALSNFFNDLQECQWLCGQRTLKYKSTNCFEPFDITYKESCTQGNWQARYYYEARANKCQSFWYDGCVGKGQNFFTDEGTCIDNCVAPPSAPSSMPKSPSGGGRKHLPGATGHSPRAQHHAHTTTMPPSSGQGGADSQPAAASGEKMAEDVAKPAAGGKGRGDPATKPRIVPAMPKGKERTSPASSGNRYDICAEEQPCQNNGTCVTTANSSYYCECAPGYTNDNCTERVEFDPCAEQPCLHGGTCAAKAGRSKTTFECLCTAGRGGERCELEPCAGEPCKNNGTCRTTRAGPPWHFCECAPGWGGKNCILETPSTKMEDSPTDQGGSAISGDGQLSSGKVEWIEEIQRDLSQTVGPDSDDGDSQKGASTSRGSNADEVEDSFGGKETAGHTEPIVGVEEPTRTLVAKANGEGSANGAQRWGSSVVCYSCTIAMLSIYIIPLITMLLMMPLSG